MAAARFGVVARIVARDIDDKIVGGKEAHSALERQGVLVGPVIIACGVVLVAVVIKGSEGEPREELVLKPAEVDRHIQNQARIDATVVPGSHLDPSAKLLLWLYCGDVDRAAGGIFPEKGSLRSAQDLELRHVHDIQDAALGTCHVDPVDVDAHAGLVWS